MESAIQLKYCGYLSITSPGISSTIGTGNKTSFQLNYNRASISLSCTSRHQVRPALSQVTCKGYSFSGIFNNGNYKRRKSTSINAQLQLPSAKTALETLLGMSKYLATAEPPEPESDDPELPQPPPVLSVSDVDNMKDYAMELIKSRRPSKAVSTLENEYRKKQKARESEVAYFLDLAIVEIYICLGNYTQAAKRECLLFEPCERPIGDSRLPLYKAILHTLLKENDEAEKWWTAFMETIHGGGLSDVPIDPQCSC